MLLQQYAPQWKTGVVISVSASPGLSCNFGIHVNRSLIFVQEGIGSGGTLLPSLDETVRRTDIEVWTVQTSDRTPVQTGAGWAELRCKRQNLNRSNSDVCLQSKSANLRTCKTVTACLWCDEAKLWMEKWHLSHKREFNRPKCYTDTRTLNPWLTFNSYDHIIYCTIIKMKFKYQFASKEPRITYI